MSGAARSATPASATANVPHARATTTTAAHATTPRAGARWSWPLPPPRARGVRARHGLSRRREQRRAGARGHGRRPYGRRPCRGARRRGTVSHPVRVGLPTVAGRVPARRRPAGRRRVPRPRRGRRPAVGAGPRARRATGRSSSTTARPTARPASPGPPVRLVVHEPRRGFGAACAAGLAVADAPIVAFCDADASLDPAALPAVVAPVAAGEADLVLGARRPTTRGAIAAARRAAPTATSPAGCAAPPARR